MTVSYKSKAELERVVRERLQNFFADDPIWLWLLSRHPERDEKTGCGVRRFFVTPNPLNRKALQLNIERTDGSRVDISWKTCISSKPMSDDEKIRKAMRRSISGQVIDFSLTHKQACSLCGVEGESMHVDHYDPKFEGLVRDFFDRYPERPTIFSDCRNTNAPIFREQDWVYEKAWQDFHRLRARLRVLCQSCNLLNK